jgi:hypothetical protein
VLRSPESKHKDKHTDSGGANQRTTLIDFTYLRCMRCSTRTAVSGSTDCRALHWPFPLLCFAFGPSYPRRVEGSLAHEPCVPPPALLFPSVRRLGRSFIRSLSTPSDATPCNVLFSNERTAPRAVRSRRAALPGAWQHDLDRPPHQAAAPMQHNDHVRRTRRAHLLRASSTRSTIRASSTRSTIRASSTRSTIRRQVHAHAW